MVMCAMGCRSVRLGDVRAFFWGNVCFLGETCVFLEGRERWCFFLERGTFLGEKVFFWEEGTFSWRDGSFSWRQGLFEEKGGAFLGERREVRCFY